MYKHNYMICRAQRTNWHIHRHCPMPIYDAALPYTYAPINPYNHTPTQPYHWTSSRRRRELSDIVLTAFNMYMFISSPHKPVREAVKDSQCSTINWDKGIIIPSQWRIQGNTRQYKAIQGNARQYKAIQGNTRQCKRMQPVINYVGHRTGVGRRHWRGVLL